MKDQHNYRLFELCLATLFISSSGVLGKFIDMPTPVLIWWRSALAMICLFVFIRIRKINFNTHGKKDTVGVIVSALFLGAHWITYFYALKLSNVAIGMLSLYTFPVITALLEPLFFKSKLDPVHILLGTMVLAGIYILAPELEINSSAFQGVLMGVLSAICYALRILILKQFVSKYNSTGIMFIQLIVLSIVLIPVLLLMDTSGIHDFYPYVILLAVVTTALGHTLFVNSLKFFSASTASIITSILPVFGIILAYFFLNEIPSTNTYLGGALIISTVLFEARRSRKN